MKRKLGVGFVESKFETISIKFHAFGMTGNYIPKYPKRKAIAIYQTNTKKERYTEGRTHLQRLLQRPVS
jgi:hypothetical protein